MFELAKRLFRRKDLPSPDFGKDIERCLLNLPPCTAKVVVMSPKYDDQYYQCEVIADTVRLAAWAEHHASSCSSIQQEDQAARLALPLWLKGADLRDMTPAHVAPHVVGVLRPYLMDLVSQEIAVVVCPVCQQIVEDLSMKRLNERSARPWAWWTSEWSCECGHLLYREDHEVHFHFKS
jgi:hypothetical protein